MMTSMDVAFAAVESWHEAHEEAVAGWDTNDTCPGCERGADADEITDAVMAALESGVRLATDGNGEEVRGLDVDDVVPGAITELANEVCDFWHTCGHDLDGIGAGQVGYDFNLTRNRHGTGFWDRNLGEVGDRLTAAAHPFGEWTLYLGDDGKLHA